MTQTEIGELQDAIETQVKRKATIKRIIPVDLPSLDGKRTEHCEVAVFDIVDDVTIAKCYAFRYPATKQTPCIVLRDDMVTDEVSEGDRRSARFARCRKSGHSVVARTSIDVSGHCHQP